RSTSTSTRWTSPRNTATSPPISARPSTTASPHTASCSTGSATTSTGTSPRTADTPRGPPQRLAGARSDAAQHRHDDAEHDGLVAVDDVVGGVARFEVDVAAAAAEHLDGGLAVDHCGDDLAGVSLGLLPHHDDVPVADRGVDHRVAAHAQAEHVATSGELAGQGQRVVEVFVRGDRRSRGDVTDHGHGNRVLSGLSCRRLPEERADVDRPRHGAAAAEETLLL